VFNPLNSKLNPICYILTLLGAHHILHVSWVKFKTFLVTYITHFLPRDLFCSHVSSHFYPRFLLTFSPFIYYHLCISFHVTYTWCFIMYSEIKKNYYRKTVVYTFTKPLQIQGTIHKRFFPSKLFFIVVHNFCR
jgi:hypothetical protein